MLIANTRGPLSLAGLVSELGPTTRAVTPRQAALADLVIIAIPFVRIPELVAEIGDCSGRVMVDATNQFATYQPYSGYVDLGEQTGTEWVAAHLPGAIMIKAFNAMFGSYLRPDPRHPEGRQVVFFAGDEDGACAQFAEFVDKMGFAPVCGGPPPRRVAAAARRCAERVACPQAGLTLSGASAGAGVTREPTSTARPGWSPERTPQRCANGAATKLVHTRRLTRMANGRPWRREGTKRARRPPSRPKAGSVEGDRSDRFTCPSSGHDTNRASPGM